MVFEIKTGSELQLSTEEKYKYSGDQHVIYVDHKNISHIVNVGDLVYIDEGRISLKVIATQSTCLSTGRKHVMVVLVIMKLMLVAYFFLLFFSFFVQSRGSKRGHY